MVKERIAILGDGGWGTALSLVLARKGISPLLWGAFPEYIEEMSRTRENRKFLPGISLPEAVELTTDLTAAISDATIILCAIPTTYIRRVLEPLKEVSFKDKIIVSCAKGIENDSLLTPLQIISTLIHDVPVAVLSGPSHAEEVAQSIPTCTVVAAPDETVSKKIQSLFMEERFRVYVSNDSIGVELGGALKNVIALAAGICDGLAFGANTKAALLSRGLQEIVRLGVRMGARAETFFGLSGLGDLVTTCISSFGRNRLVGERIGKGESLRDIVATMEMVAEGVATTRSAYDLSAQYEVDMPITHEVYRVLYQDKEPLQSISDLMSRGSKEEINIQFLEKSKKPC